MGQKYAHLDANRFVIGFYADDVHEAHQIPDGAVAIDDEHHAALLEGQSAGKLMKLDVDDLPLLVDPPPPTSDELAALARAERNARLTETDWVLQRHQEETLMNMSLTLTPEEGTALAVYRQALRDIPEQPGFPEVIDWPVPPVLS